MKIERGLFFVIGLFFVPVTLAYIAMGGEPVGIGALSLSAGLGLMVAGYLWLTMRKLPVRAEDDDDATVEQHPGVQGEFSPYSWWPLPLAACAAVIFFGLAVAWWVAVIGAVMGVVALVGWVFEYYRGAFAH